jgi:tRNA pseudouridine38-40 synthase
MAVRLALPVSAGHDFTSFAAVEGTAEEENSAELCDAGARHHVARWEKIQISVVRRLFASRLLRRPRTAMLIYEVTGNGFLHHMVRNIVGTLVEVGRGKFHPKDITRILDARDRTMAGPTAPAQGLCLTRVEY